MKARCTQQQREAQRIGRQDCRAGQFHGPCCDHTRHLGKASGILGTACCPHQPRRIDHRSRTAREHFVGASQRRFAKIGIADGVDNKGVRGDGLAGIIKIGMDRGDVEMTVIDPVPRRNVAAARGNQQQKRHAESGATIRLPDDGMVGKAFLPVRFRRFIGKLSQNQCQTLMRFRKVGIDAERCLVMRPCAGDITVLQQQIGEIDVADRIAGMALHRLEISSARSRSVAARLGKGAKLIEGGKMRRIET